jgi:hypothetical protein
MLTLATEPKFSILADKFPLLGADKITFEMLANSSFPSKAEQTAIAAYMNVNAECSKQGEAFRQKAYPPKIAAFFTDGRGIFLQIAADLYNQKITYGEANKKFQKKANELKSQMLAVDQEIQQQRATQQQLDESRQQQEQISQRQIEESRQQAQLGREAQEEAQRKQMAHQMLMNQQRYKPTPFVIPQIPFYPMPIPRNETTNCTMIGNQMNCTTR